MEFREAIAYLNVVEEGQEKNRLMVKYASILMKHETRFTIESLSSHFAKINIDELLPALLSIELNDRAFAKDYLKKKMENSNNKLLCNLYIFFLAESDLPESLTELHAYLDQQETISLTGQIINLDKDFALNVCKYFGRQEARLKVYGILGLYEESVKLALKIGKPKLAEHYANMPTDIKIKKKLWIEIAKSLMQANKSDNKICFDIIEKSKVLTLVDVLRFLSPKEKLAAFKEDLKNSLQGYGSKIDEIRKEMSDYAKCTQEITSNLKEYSNSCIPVNSDQMCIKCSKPLLGNENFYVFPCLHAFHKVKLFVQFCFRAAL